MKKSLAVTIAFFLIVTAVAQTRIITAGSAVTEIVCALGDCDKIIASDRTSLYPEKIQSLPSIGYRAGINAEGIISLKPTIIFAEKNYVEEAVLQQIKSSGLKLVIVDERQNFEDTKRAILQVAEALGKTSEGKKLIEKNQAELDEAKTLLSKTKISPRVLCVYNRGTATVSIAGKNTFAGILAYTGATNVIPDVEGYKPLNAEALIVSDPEYIVMLSTGLESVGGLDGALKIPGVAQTNAGRKKQILGIESLRLTNFGPRFGQTVKELVILLHPELNAK